jgi:hypothetical protein
VEVIYFSKCNDAIIEIQGFIIKGTKGEEE